MKTSTCPERNERVSVNRNQRLSQNPNHEEAKTSNSKKDAGVSRPTLNTGVNRGQTNPLLALLQSGFEGMRLRDTLFKKGDEIRG